MTRKGKKKAPGGAGGAGGAGLTAQGSDVIERQLATRIPAATLKRLKLHAVQTGSNVKAIVATAIEQFLAAVK